MGRVRGCGKSVRAQRTRGELVRAAAFQFDRDGYEGTSLARICAEADTSLGALTFHFASKAGLADEVQAQGRGVVRALVGEATADAVRPLEAARVLTLALVGALERDTRVRSAARLFRERAGDGPQWAAEWGSALRGQLDRAALAGQLAPYARPDDVTVLLECLVVGVEAAVRGRAAGVRPQVPARLWALLAQGIAVP